MLWSGVFVLHFIFISFVENTPVVPLNSITNCPVPTTSDEFGTKKVLDLHEIKGHKVRLQFFYPSEQTALRLIEEAASLTSTVNPGNGSNVTRPAPSSIESGESVENSQTLEDIYCQWTFKAGNESQFLALTFERLSAPYSDNCAQAFVALQKENGYESRWCGNRRQANARPMSLLAKSSAMIRVYRSGSAPLLPPTGFKVAVRELSAASLQGAENTLRVLVG